MRNPAFYPGEYYHIYNRAIGNDIVFFRRSNYSYFLKKYEEKMSPLVDTLAYCLMPNHFHFIVRVKCPEVFESQKKEKLVGILQDDDYQLINYILYQVQKGWLSGYAQDINKQEKRMGSLFMHTTRRKILTSPLHLINAIIYTHRNPIKAGLAFSLHEWEYSSYKAILEKEDFLDYKHLMEIFGKREEFVKIHQNGS